MADEKKAVNVETEVDVEAKKKEDAKKTLKGKKISKGDMILVDIMGKTIEKDSKKDVVFQASNLEDAQKLLNYDPEKNAQYVPEIAIVGKKGFVSDQITEALEGMKFFDKKEIVLEAEDAFGKREGSKIEKVKASKFAKDMGEAARPGAIYNDKKGRTGTVLRAAQGRLLVDFNHPLAGKKVSYTVEAVDKIEEFDDKIKAFVSRRLPGYGAEDLKIELDEESNTLDLDIPQMLAFQLAQQQGGIYFKMGLSMDLQEHMDEVETVRFIETYEKRAEMEHDHDHDHAEEEKEE